MSSCFEILGQYGNLIFNDAAYGVYAKKTAGTSARISTGSSITPYVHNIPAVNNQLTAVQCPSASTITFAQRKPEIQQDIYICGALNIPYIILDTPDNLTGSADYGLQVFNPAGAKIFDSGMQYFVIRDIVDISLETCAAAAAAGTKIPISHAPCTNPYYIIAGLQYITIDLIYGPYSGGRWQVWLRPIAISSNTNSSFYLWYNTTWNFYNIDEGSKNSIVAAANATHTLPQFVLVGELKNA